MRQADVRRPGATGAMVLACVLVQGAVLFMAPAERAAVYQGWGLVPARLTVGLDQGFGAPPFATLATHMFLHAGLAHLFMNMVFLLWVGRAVESGLGARRFVLLFLAGGLAGGLVQILFQPSSLVPVVGASGAVSAAFAAYALLFARDVEREGGLFGLRLSGTTVRALRLLALWIGLQLLIGALINVPGGGGIAIWAHVGGFLAGLVFAWPWARALHGGGRA